MNRAPILIGVMTFVLGSAIAVVLFAILDVDWILLVGPLIGIGFAAYAAYRTAREDEHPHRERPGRRGSRA